MTCSPFAVPEDLKVLTREGITQICPPGNVPREYEALQYSLPPGEHGTQCHYLLVGLSALYETHMRLRDVLRYKPNALHEASPLASSWHEPPYLAAITSDVLETPRD
jgi:hypothetical protein